MCQTKNHLRPFYDTRMEKAVSDQTKYQFEGQEYGKGRLVLAVIKSMVSSDNLTIGALKERFSSMAFNGHMIVSETLYSQRLEYSADTENRYFTNDSLTDSAGEVFYVSNQWGVGNIDGFVICVREYGTKIDIIADQSSQLMAYFNHYSNHPRSDWMAEYQQRCEEFKTYKISAYSDENFLDIYWRLAKNGIANAMPGVLSPSEYESLKPELPAISEKIAVNPVMAIHEEVMVWAGDAKQQGKFSTIKRGVINRFFCVCSPQTLSTILNYDHLKKFAETWNERGYGAQVSISDNWVELNSNLVKAIKMRGFELEDTFLFNTFVYRLKEYFNGDLEDPILATEPVIDSNTSKPKPLEGVSNPCNQILYGPPGTGKTYTTVKLAVSLIDPGFCKALDDSAESVDEKRLKLKKRFDELLKKGQIAFTTFHQNFSYEDFVEGLKAESDGGQISYLVEDGIFKNICEKADQVLQASGLENAITDLKEKCSEEPQKLKTYTGKTFSLSYNNGKTFSCMPETSATGKALSASIDPIRKIVLGETPENLYNPSYVKAIAKYLYDTYDINVDESALPVPHVLIIDEINRGNIAKIFGELITLLEPGKRKGQDEALTLTLPYSKEPFSVPANLHVIGTMNTADTSLAKIDIALRRRFEFKEMMPKADLLKHLLIEGVNISQLLETINQRIELLYDRDHCIGHSYFMALSSDSSITDLKEIFEKKIIPLLEEYFFNDWSLIHRVLGDHLKGPNQPKFIIKKYSDSDMKRLMGSEWQADTELHIVWELNKAALTNANAYKGVYEPQSASIDQGHVDESAD